MNKTSIANLWSKFLRIVKYGIHKLHCELAKAANCEAYQSAYKSKQNCIQNQCHVSIIVEFVSHWNIVVTRLLGPLEYFVDRE